MQENSIAHGAEGIEKNVDAVSSPRSAGAEKRGEDTASTFGSEQAALRQMEELLKIRHYSPRTLQTYTEWVQKYFEYARRQKLAWDAPETIRAWLSSLATQHNVAASTQNQAFSAVLFPFREVLKADLPELNAVRAKRGQKLPVVLTPEEVQKVFSCVEGTVGLMLRLSYGAGLRISELIRLRVQDLDFGNETLLVRSGKGGQGSAGAVSGIAEG
jgi:site-specific recombinase XerD